MLPGMSAPGKLKASELTKVQGSIALAKKTAARYKLFKAKCKSLHGWNISIAQPAGGYRSEADQNAMHHAGSRDGSRAQKIRWGLNPNSTVSIASHPYGTHETGTRVDIVGHVIDAELLRIAQHYGFIREFGSNDPNHFIDTGSYKVTLPKAVKAATVSGKVTVTIKAGDTLGEIAEQYRTTVAKIMGLNPKITNANAIAIGQKVRVA